MDGQYQRTKRYLIVLANVLLGNPNKYLYTNRQRTLYEALHKYLAIIFAMIIYVVVLQNIMFPLLEK